MRFNRFLAATALVATVSFSIHAAAQDSSSALEHCRSLAEKGDVAAAEPVCARAAEESPTEGKLIYADLLQYKGDATAAIARYCEILEGVDLAKATPVELAALQHRAFVHFNAESYESAGKDAEQFLNYQPNDVQMLQLASEIDTLPLERRLSYTDRLVASNPKSADGHIYRARLLLRAGENEQAMAAILRAIKLDPKSGMALATRGFIYSAMGDFKKAERDHAAVARLIPKDPDVRANRAEALFAMDQYEKTIEAATEALQIKPDHARSLRLRATARVQMGDGAGARADVEAGRKAAPDEQWWDLESAAEDLVEVHETLDPARIAAIAADRATVLGEFSRYLSSTCGYFSVNKDDEDSDALNEQLDTYRNCIVKWYEGDDQDWGKSVSSAATEAAGRLDKAVHVIKTSSDYRCSRTRKHAKCVKDAVYSQAETVVADLEDPKGFVGMQEMARLNREVDSYNAAVSRHNAAVGTANFLRALSEALSEQNQQ